MSDTHRTDVRYTVIYLPPTHSNSSKPVWYIIDNDRDAYRSPHHDRTAAYAIAARLNRQEDPSQ